MNFLGGVINQKFGIPLHSTNVDVWNNFILD